MVKTIHTMTRQEFRDVPPCQDKPPYCTAFVIVPLRTKHDSGYRNMQVVACNENLAVCSITCSTDIIGLYNCDPFRASISSLISQEDMPYRWSVDCLPASGLLRISMQGNGKLKVTGGFGGDVDAAFVPRRQLPNEEE
jgi:hypothetical protein